MVENGHAKGPNMAKIDQQVPFFYMVGSVLKDLYR